MSVKGGIMVPHPPLIIPEVGRGREKEIQTTIDAYHSAARKLASWQPDTVVVLSPHFLAAGYSGGLVSSFGNVYGLFSHFTGNSGRRRFRTVRRAPGKDQSFL